MNVVKVKRIVNSVFNSNTFIVYEKGEAIIIDIDIGDFDPLMRFIKDEELKVSALFITHTHYDHIYGIRDFMKNYPDMPIYTSSFGKEALNRSNWNFSRYHEDIIEIDSDSIVSVCNGERIRVFEDKELEVISTPGHDKSSLSFILEDMLFTGDSYIPGVKVIDTFPNSNREDARYWYGRLEAFSQAYIVCPGHGDILNNLRVHSLKSVNAGVADFSHIRTCKRRSIAGYVTELKGLRWLKAARRKVFLKKI